MDTLDREKAAQEQVWGSGFDSRHLHHGDDWWT